MQFKHNFNKILLGFMQKKIFYISSKLKLLKKNFKKAFYGGLGFFPTLISKFSVFTIKLNNLFRNSSI